MLALTRADSGVPKLEAELRGSNQRRPYFLEALGQAGTQPRVPGVLLGAAQPDEMYESKSIHTYMYHIQPGLVYNCALERTEVVAAEKQGAPRKQRGSEEAAGLNKHQQKTKATKKRLLKSALRIFTRDGFERASIDDIAAEAGYTRGAFYAHFQSKEDLFFAMLEEESHKHFEALTEVMQGLASERERLEALREYYVTRVADRQWSILTVEFKLYALRHPKLRAKLAGTYRSIRSKMKWSDIARVWERRPEHNSEADETVRVALQVVLNGLVLERAYDPASISDNQVSELLRTLFDFLTESSHCGARRQSKARVRPSPG